jgi:serine/threonine-protein kinase PpkA
VLGNVLEWTCSEYDPGYGGAETRCAAATSDAPLVLRGGAWNSGPAAVRAAYRNRNYPESRYNFVGFRIARDADSPSPTQSP